MIFIQTNVPSSKNSKMKTRHGLINSPLVMKYKNTTALQWVLFKNEFIASLEGKEKPYKIGFHFIRGSKHRFDFINPCQTIQDEMVRYEWLDDDNMDEMVPVALEKEGKFYSYDKENAGVIIEVL